ncbi:hypothetical protein [Colwellia sp. E150_009]
MNTKSFFKKIENKFIITPADLGNLPHSTTLEVDDETGESILLMPKKVYGDYAEVDDVMSFNKPSKYRIVMVNLSCKFTKKTTFLREYTSICKQVISPKHPLNRLILECDGEYYLLKPKKFKELEK